MRGEGREGIKERLTVDSGHPIEPTEDVEGVGEDHRHVSVSGGGGVAVGEEAPSGGLEVEGVEVVDPVQAIISTEYEELVPPDRPRVKGSLAREGRAGTRFDDFPTHHHGRGGGVGDVVSIIVGAIAVVVIVGRGGGVSPL